MQCPACGEEFEPKGVFPGAHVPCTACGQSVLVPPLPRPTFGMGAPAAVLLPADAAAPPPGALAGLAVSPGPLATLAVSPGPLAASPPAAPDALAGLAAWPPDAASPLHAAPASPPLASPSGADALPAAGAPPAPGTWPATAASATAAGPPFAIDARAVGSPGAADATAAGPTAPSDATAALDVRAPGSPPAAGVPSATIAFPAPARPFAPVPIAAPAVALPVAVDAPPAAAPRAVGAPVVAPLAALDSPALAPPVAAGSFPVAMAPADGSYPGARGGAPALATAPGSGACPRCGDDLAAREAGGKVVGACDAGHGLFVAHATLRELQASARAAPAVGASLDVDAAFVEGETRTLRCPRCGDAMTRRASARGAGVVVDVCGEHGVWFDAGELKAALGAAPPDEPGGAALGRQSKATLDVALALEKARDDGRGARALDALEDAVGLFELAVFGQDLGPNRPRRRW